MEKYFYKRIEILKNSRMNFVFVEIHYLMITKESTSYAKLTESNLGAYSTDLDNRIQFRFQHRYNKDKSRTSLLEKFPKYLHGGDTIQKNV